MNCFDAYPLRRGPGWLAMARYSHKGQAWPVMDGDGPKIFTSANAAKMAALEALMQHMNGTMRTARDEAKDRAEDAWSAVAAPKLVRQSRTKRLVAVERK